MRPDVDVEEMLIVIQVLALDVTKNNDENSFRRGIVIFVCESFTLATLGSTTSVALLRISIFIKIGGIVYIVKPVSNFYQSKINGL